MNRSAVTAAVVIIGVLGQALQAQVVVGTWDGGDGRWEDAKWNGGQTAAAVFGDNRLSDGAFDVTIGGGAQVLYDGATLRDFRPRSNEGPTRITIKDGAELELNSDNTDVDGIWTQFDADLILDGGTFKRSWTAGGSTEAGGLNMFGSWRSVENQQIDVLLKNGGRIENDGQLWFGADEDHAAGLKVFMVVDNGHLDLTGGSFPTANSSNEVTAEMAFFYGVGEVDPKGEDYRINFRGPGSVTVDADGIDIYDQDASLFWTVSENVSYETLWNRGILRSKGMSGREAVPGSGVPSSAFANHFTVTGEPGQANYTLTRKDPTVVTWDGGSGDWTLDAKWNTGQTAAAVLGRSDGTNGGEAIVLDGSKPGGADVVYDPNLNGDFRVLVGEGVSSLTIKNGASLSMNSASDIDSKWTRIGSDLTIDGGTFSRTKDGVNSLNGGLMMLGGFAQRWGQEIDVNIINGGRLENDGQLWFGSPSPAGNATDLAVTMTINNGTVDLTGGDTNVDMGAIPETLLSVLFDEHPDLVFTYLFRTDDNTEGPLGPANEKHTINFTGPGSLTVDHSGIFVATEVDESGTNFTVDDKTYQDLWDLGILQANGQSGLDGATFGDFFTVAGTLGADNYTLTSKLTGGGAPGDFNNDGVVDGSDFLVWQQGGSPNPVSAADLAEWRANFGSGGAAGSIGAVPEPASAIVAAVGLMGLAAVRRRRAA